MDLVGQAGLERSVHSHFPLIPGLPYYAGTTMISVLFLCAQNSARSQMAEAYLKKFGGDSFKVDSAGLKRGELNPHVVRAMQEDGIDISSNRTQAVFDLCQSGKAYRYIITVCSPEAVERFPVFPRHVEKLHWFFRNPCSFTGSDEEILGKVREVRNAIKARVRLFVVQTPNTMS